MKKKTWFVLPVITLLIAFCLRFLAFDRDVAFRYIHNPEFNPFFELIAVSIMTSLPIFLKGKKKVWFYIVGAFLPFALFVNWLFLSYNNSLVVTSVLNSIVGYLNFSTQLLILICSAVCITILSIVFIAVSLCEKADSMKWPFRLHLALLFVFSIIELSWYLSLLFGYQNPLGFFVSITNNRWIYSVVQLIRQDALLYTSIFLVIQYFSTFVNKKLIAKNYRRRTALCLWFIGSSLGIEWLYIRKRQYLFVFHYFSFLFIILGAYFYSGLERFNPVLIILFFAVASIKLFLIFYSLRFIIHDCKIQE